MLKRKLKCVHEKRGNILGGRKDSFLAKYFE